MSALDAQLDALGPAPSFDVLALARSYAGAIDALSAVDEALATLEAGVSLPAPDAIARDAAPVIAESAEQIVLPEPLRDALLAEEPTATSTLDEASARVLEFEAEPDAPITVRRDNAPALRESGAFTVTHLTPRDDSRDITMETVDEELIEAEIDDMRPEAAPLGGPAGSLFDTAAKVDAAAERQADAAFAALFAEATRQSSMPSTAEPDNSGQNDLFESSALSIDPGSISLNPRSIDPLSLKPSVPYDLAVTKPASRRPEVDGEVELEPGFHDETLDSAEFEIVNDVVTDGRGSEAPNARPSRPPEKRPSFLGRLFSRKDE
ncbi:MAG TPA: hypothetical protein VI299_23900 [Polyangiales bacterium]